MTVDQAVLEYLQEHNEKTTQKRPSARVKVMVDFLKWYIKKYPPAIGISVQENVGLKDRMG